MNMTNNDFFSKLLMAPSDAPGATPADPAPAPAAEPTPSPEPQAPDYSWVPESFIKDGAPDFASLRQTYDELAAFKAQRDEATAGIPETADGYDLTVPTDLDFGELELPEGFQFTLSDDERVKPLLDGMRGLLHKHGLPQDAAGELLGLMARYEAIQVADSLSAQKKEAEALGPQAEARIANINRALEAKLPADLAAAIKAATTSANGVRALEKLLSPTPFSTGPASPAGPDVEAMTPAQKLAYANAQQAAKRA